MFSGILVGMLLIVQAADADFQPVANVNEIMNALVIPSSNVVGNVGLDGEPDDEAWAEVERQALVLAESGNLLLMPSRAQGRSQWVEASIEMIRAAESALEAARSRDLESLSFDISGAIFDSCSSCHDQYFN